MFPKRDWRLLTERLHAFEAGDVPRRVEAEPRRPLEPPLFRLLGQHLDNGCESGPFASRRQRQEAPWQAFSAATRSDSCWSKAVGFA